MALEPLTLSTRVATLALPTRESHVSAAAWSAANGTLLMVAEFNLSASLRQELTGDLAAAVERGWKKAPPAPSADGALEYLLVALNETLKLHEHAMGNPLAPRYHLVVAVLRGNELALAHVGLAAAYLVSIHRLTNLFTREERRPSTPTFQNLVAGKLTQEEALVLTTPALLDYVSPDRLRELMGTEAPGAALREIEAAVTTLPHHEALALACLRFGEATQTVGTGASMHHLLNTQAQTSQLLRPKLWTSLTSRFTLRNSTPQPEGPTVAQPPTSTRPTRLTKARGGYRLLQKFGALLRLLTSRENTKAALSNWAGTKLTVWRRLPLTRRVILVLAMVLIVAFCQSIVELGRTGLRSRDSEAYNQLVAQITEHSAEAESALIYHDEARARTLVDESKALLNQLPSNGSTREQQHLALQKTLDVLVNKLEHRGSVSQLSKLSELPTDPLGATWQALTVANGSIYVAANNGNVVRLDPSGKTTGSLMLPHQMAALGTLNPIGNELLITAQNGQQAIADLELKHATLVTKPLSMIDIGTYQNRLYNLGGTPTTLLYTTRQGDGFTTPQPWLKSSQPPLAGATSLSVDGAIYVARGTSLEKYVRGIKQTFNLTPAPSAPITWVRTGDDKDNLYLWSKDQSITIYDKQGKLLVNLSLPTLAAGSTAAYDASTKSLLLLSGNQLYRVPLAEYVLFSNQ